MLDTKIKINSKERKESIENLEAEIKRLRLAVDERTQQSERLRKELKNSSPTRSHRSYTSNSSRSPTLSQALESGTGKDLASVAGSVLTGGVINPVIVKTLGLDKIVSGAISKTWGLAVSGLRTTRNGIKNLYNQPNPQDLRHGRTSAIERITTNSAYLPITKRLDTIIHILKQGTDTKKSVAVAAEKEKKGLLKTLLPIAIGLGLLWFLTSRSSSFVPGISAAKQKLNALGDALKIGGGALGGAALGKLVGGPAGAVVGATLGTGVGAAFAEHGENKRRRELAEKGTYAAGHKYATLSGAAIGTGAGGLVGAKLGATAGSIGGPAGAALGAVVGLLLGAAVGGIADAVSDHKIAKQAAVIRLRAYNDTFKKDEDVLKEVEKAGGSKKYLKNATPNQAAAYYSAKAHKPLHKEMKQHVALFSQYDTDDKKGVLSDEELHKLALTTQIYGTKTDDKFAGTLLRMRILNIPLTEENYVKYMDKYREELDTNRKIFRRTKIPRQQYHDPKAYLETRFRAFDSANQQKQNDFLKTQHDLIERLPKIDFPEIPKATGDQTEKALSLSNFAEKGDVINSTLLDIRQLLSDKFASPLPEPSSIKIPTFQHPNISLPGL